ncbi:MAG: LCP family protein [Myxococcota bacterium]
MAEQRRRWRWWLLAFALTGAAGIAWATTLGADTSKHAAARLVRAAVGPPQRLPQPSLELADADEDVEVEPELEPVVVVPDVAAPVEPPPPPKKPRGLRNVSFVLLLGMDNRHDRVTGRTDTMVVAAFRHRDGKVGAFSVPRDLYVEDPELGPMRISSAVRVGNKRLGKGKGVPFLRQLIEREFGIRIDRYAAVDLAGFVDVVDEVGGVEVDVQCAIRDCLWMGGKDEEACEDLTLDAGRQVLDGRTALKFVRSRHGRGDRDRRRRQQKVLIAFARAARARGLTELQGLWETVEPFVSTDMDWKAAAYYGSFAFETDLSDLHGFSVARKMVRKHVTEKKQHVLLLDHALFDEALGDMFGRTLPGLRERKRCPDADAAEQARSRR